MIVAETHVVDFMLFELLMLMFQNSTESCWDHINLDVATFWIEQDRVERVSACVGLHRCALFLFLPIVRYHLSNICFISRCSAARSHVVISNAVGLCGVMWFVTCNTIFVRAWRT